MNLNLAFYYIHERIIKCEIDISDKYKKRKISIINVYLLTNSTTNSNPETIEDIYNMLHRQFKKNAESIIIAGDFNSINVEGHTKYSELIARFTKEKNNENGTFLIDFYLSLNTNEFATPFLNTKLVNI